MSDQVGNQIVGFLMTRLKCNAVTDADHKLFGTAFMIAYCCRLGDSLQPKTLFLTGFDMHLLIEPRSEKTGLRGFRPGLTQTGLYSHRK